MLIHFYLYSANTNPKVQLVGFVENYTSCYFERSYNGIGKFNIVVDIYDEKIIDVIKNSNIVGINDSYGIIDNIQESKNQDGFQIQINGLELKALAMRRIVEPPQNAGYLIYNDSPEAVIANLIETQLINPTDNNRKIHGTIAAYEESATTIKYEGRYQNLADEIQTLGETYNIGWKAIIKDNAIQWVIYKGKDRRSDQVANEPLILSYNYDAVNESILNYTYSYTNYAYVAGQGEGAQRDIQEVGQKTGLWRNEVFVDARDLQTSADLIQRGKEKLSAFGDEVSYTATLSSSMVSKYKIDFDIGDLGTIENELLDNIDFRLVSVTEVYEGDYLNLEINLGYDKRNLVNTLRNLSNKSNSILLA